MSEDKGFLARWSHRKRAGDEPQPQAAPPADPPAQGEREPGEPELAPDELALLPSLEDITAETDVTGFLRRGVPASLRNAALRQAWLLDPTVRDRIGDALDYAWDYNTPGGAPGYGPIEAGMDVGGMVTRMFSRSTAEPSPTPAQVTDVALPHSEAVQRESRAAEPEPSEEVAAAGLAAIPAELPSGGEGFEADLVEAQPTEPPSRPARRRHGGAMPL